MEPDLLDRLRTAAHAMSEKKAFHLIALDVSTKTSIADAFLLCSVGSGRQGQAVADEVERALKEGGTRPLSVEGYREGSWVLLDYGDFVVHVFLEERRDHYALERLWGDAPEITDVVRPVG